MAVEISLYFALSVETFHVFVVLHEDELLAN